MNTHKNIEITTTEVFMKKRFELTCRHEKKAQKDGLKLQETALLTKDMTISGVKKL